MADNIFFPETTKEEIKEDRDYELMVLNNEIASEFNKKYEELMGLINYPPLNLNIVRNQLVEKLIDAQKKMVNLTEKSENPYDYVFEKFKSEIDKAKIYKSKYKTVKAAMLKYLEDNPQTKLVNFVRGGIDAE